MASGLNQQRADIAGDDASAESNAASWSQTISPINHFDKLPNELLVKIFRFYLNRMYSRGLSHRQINERLNMICLTCKRFCYIINDVLLSEPEWKGIIPTLYIAPSVKWDGDVRHGNHKRQKKSDYWFYIRVPWAEIHPLADQYHRLPILYRREKACPVTSNCHYADFTPFDWNQMPPGIDFNPNLLPDLYVLQNPEMRWVCEYTNDPACFCQNTIRKEAHYMLKHRSMSIRDLNLLQKCLPKAIRDESNNLTSINELYLGYCKFDVEILDNILTSLPNVRRLRLQNLRECVPRQKQQPQLDLVGRTLDYLSFDFDDKVDEYLFMFDYLLAKLPARIIDAQMASYPANLRWIRQYLLAHRATIKDFGFKLFVRQNSYVDSSKVSGIFQDFSYKIRRDYRMGECLEVISSSCPRSIAYKMFSCI